MGSRALGNAVLSMFVVVWFRSPARSALRGPGSVLEGTFCVVVVVTDGSSGLDPVRATETLLSMVNILGVVLAEHAARLSGRQRRRWGRSGTVATLWIASVFVYSRN